MQENLKNSEKYLQEIMKYVFIDGLENYEPQYMAENIRKSIKIIKNQIILHALDEHVHYKAFLYVMNKCEDYDLRINPDKSKFYQGNVECLGRVIDSYGVTICLDERKNLKTIVDMPESSDQCKSLVNYFVLFKNHLITDEQKQLFQLLTELSKRFDKLKSLKELHTLESTVQMLKNILINSGTKPLRPIGNSMTSTQVPSTQHFFVSCTINDKKELKLALSESSDSIFYKLNKFIQLKQSDQSQAEFTQSQIDAYPLLPPNYHYKTEDDGRTVAVIGRQIEQSTAESN